jgi:hypothetical protein
MEYGVWELLQAYLQYGNMLSGFVIMAPGTFEKRSDSRDACAGYHD